MTEISPLKMQPRVPGGEATVTESNSRSNTPACVLYHVFKLRRGFSEFLLEIFFLPLFRCLPWNIRSLTKQVAISSLKAVLYWCLPNGGPCDCVAGVVISIHAQLPLKSYRVWHAVRRYEKYHSAAVLFQAVPLHNKLLQIWWKPKTSHLEQKGWRRTVSGFLKQKTSSVRLPHSSHAVVY